MEIDVDDVYYELKSAVDIFKGEYGKTPSFMNIERDTCVIQGLTDYSGAINKIKINCLVPDNMDLYQRLDLLKSSDNCAYKIDFYSNNVYFMSTNAEKDETGYVLKNKLRDECRYEYSKIRDELVEKISKELGCCFIDNDNKKIVAKNLESFVNSVDAVISSCDNIEYKLVSEDLDSSLATSLRTKRKWGSSYQELEVSISKKNCSNIENELKKGINICERAGYDFSSDDWNIPFDITVDGSFYPTLNTSVSDNSIFSEFTKVYENICKSSYRSPRNLEGRKGDLSLSAKYSNGNAFPNTVELTGATENYYSIDNVLYMADNLTDGKDIALDLKMGKSNIRFYLKSDNDGYTLYSNAFMDFKNRDLLNASTTILDLLKAEYSTDIFRIHGNMKQHLDSIDKIGLIETIDSLLYEYGDISIDLSFGEAGRPDCNFKREKIKHSPEILETISVKIDLGDNEEKKEEIFASALKTLQPIGLDFNGYWEVKANNKIS